MFPIIVVSPFLLSLAGMVKPGHAIVASVVLVNLIIFLLGVYLGHISRENKVKTGGTMLAVSLGATFILFIVSKLT